MLEEIRKIPHEQVVMAFVATCVESTARKFNINYREIFERIDKAGVIDNYIVPFYDVLHCESRDILADRIMECLINWEKKDL